MARGVRITVTWEGDMESWLGGLGQQVQAGAEDSMGSLAKNALSVMQGRTPVRTGRLRSGDQMDGGGMNYELYNEVPYAGCVEERKPFLRPAMLWAEGAIGGYLEKALEAMS